ncbi:BldB protein [Streptomyces filamentosus NRRL 11379]|nr:BldB protein [Streptomyces filamentosus NRRL 15998]EWS94936.1 BldB protein [Streptomyces filamentosus NRRL 11379]
MSCSAHGRPCHRGTWTTHRIRSIEGTPVMGTQQEKDELYALDISDVTWLSAPGTEEAEERVEIAHLPGGGVAMRSSLDPDTVLRYTEAEWTAFVLGARDGEFDLT